MTTSTKNRRQQPADHSDASEPRPKLARFDCWKTDGAIILSGDFPGVHADQLNIEFHDQVLRIIGASATGHDFGRAVKSEFARRSLERSFRIYEEINADEIKATYNNGVLTVELPIVQPMAPRQIPVSSC